MNSIMSIMLVCLVLFSAVFISGCTQAEQPASDDTYDQAFAELEQELDSMSDDTSGIESELLT